VLTTLSWNLAGLAEGQIDDWIEQVTCLTPEWDFLLLQESFLRLEGVCTGQHRLLTPSILSGRFKIPCILVNQRWAQHVKLAGSGARWVACTFGDVMLVTAHLPHSGRGQLEYELTMEELGAFMDVNVRFRFMVGVDANAKLWGTTDFCHVGEQVLRAAMSAEDRERARALHSFIASRGLVAINTFANTEEMADLVTRTNWNGTGASQIDYVLAAEAIPVINVKVGDAEWFTTDHRPIICSWRLADEVLADAPARIRCLRNWVPSESWEARAADMLDWSNWQDMAEHIRETASWHRVRKSRPKDDPTLAALLAERLKNIDVAVERNRLNTAIWKRRRCLRRWAAVAELAKIAETGAAPITVRSRHVNWKVIAGNVEPTVALTAFYGAIFNPPPAERAAAKEERQRCMTTARDLAVDNGRPMVSRTRLDAALAKLKRGKGSGDGVTAEMLQALPETARNALAINLTERCSKLDFPPDWCASFISLVPKVVGVTSLAGFRPVAGLVTMRKLLGYIWLASLPQIRFFSIQTAFVPGSHADTGPFLLNRASELAREWRYTLAICQVDIHKAFDHVCHAACFTAMRRKNISPYSIGLIAALWDATTVVVGLGHSVSDPIGMSRGLPQGAPESPMVFTLLIDLVLESVAEKWKSNGWGFSVDSFYVSGIAYADDIVLVAHTAEHLQEMAADVARELRAVGLGIGAAKTHWTSTPTQEGAHLNVEGSLVAWEPAITFVGTVIDLSGTCGPAMAYRMAQADKCFAKWRGPLTCSHVSLKRRLALLPLTVWNALLWSSSTWCTTKVQRSQLASWSARVIAKVANVKRRSDSDSATHWRLLHRTGHQLAASQGIAVVPRARLRVFKWAGHLARLSPKAPAAAALRCRNLQWWRWRQQNFLTEPRVPGVRGAHPRRFRIQRWEEQMSVHFAEGANTGWLLRAQDRQAWRAASAAAAAA
jgi:hypothetical protein